MCIRARILSLTWRTNLYPGGAWRGRLLDREVLYSVHLSPLCCDCGVWVGGGGCLHSPRGPAYYLCLGLGQLSPGSMDLRPRVCDLLISFIDFKIE